MCLRDTLYLFLAIAIIAYALRQIKFTQLLYFLYVSLNFLRNFYFYALLLFIQKHHILFIIGFLIIFILLNILCLYLFNHILKSICNQSTLRKKHNKIFMLNIVIPYGSAFLLGTSLATLFIKKILPISIIIGIITLVLIYLINYLFLSKFLHVSSNLQQ